MGYDYLKKWLSRQDIKEIREGNNVNGTVLTQRQVYNIMKNPKANFRFWKLLIERANSNEELYNKYSPKQHATTTNL